EEAEHAARDAIAAGAGSIDGAHARVVFARLLLARPDGAEPASDLARAALIALWGEGHAAVDPVIVLDAVAATAAGRVASLEVYLDALPTDRLDGVVRAAYAHAESTPEAALVVLMRLAAYLADRRSPELAIGPWVVATNVARRLGDHRARIDALRRLVGAHRGGGRSADAARAGLGLATAWVDAGESAAAEAAYRGALADAGSDRILASEVRSALGLFLASDGRPDEARPVLQDAAASGSPRAFVALGVFLAHNGDPESARAVLELAARALDPDEPDRLPAMVHLDSLASGRPCGCGDPDAVLAATVRAVIAPDAPDGLLTALAVEVHDGESQVRVGLGREPRPGELEQLDALIRDAIAVTRRRLGR
ncbi:MAG: hypothetical protein ABMB14_32345, partial [Myxococcota bacterium]